MYVKQNYSHLTCSVLIQRLLIARIRDQNDESGKHEALKKAEKYVHFTHPHLINFSFRTEFVMQE